VGCGAWVGGGGASVGLTGARVGIGVDRMPGSGVMAGVSGVFEVVGVGVGWVAVGDVVPWVDEFVGLAVGEGLGVEEAVEVGLGVRVSLGRAGTTGSPTPLRRTAS
jgi:hypothetical protein